MRIVFHNVFLLVMQIRGLIQLNSNQGQDAQWTVIYITISVLDWFASILFSPAVLATDV